MAAPRVFTVPAGRPFVDELARGLLDRYGAAPLDLSRVTVLVPTRRAARALADAMLRQSGGRPVLLPAMRPIGDVDADTLGLVEGGLGIAPGVAELPPAIGETRRLLWLARLVRAFPIDGDRPPEPAQAARLAGELARLIDRVQTFELDFRRLPDLVGGELAVHWDRIVAFLRVVTEAWPAILAENGVLDPVDRRTRLIRALAASWRQAPPDGPVLAVALPGAPPAQADLLATVARLPDGAVVLPGLDPWMEAEDWALLRTDAPPDDDLAAHPQFGLRQVLDGLEVDRREVDPWTEVSPPPRTALWSEAMRPARTTPKWRARAPALDPASLDGLTRLDLADPGAEAQAIALLLREALEAADRTAALVTPDRDLARRVAAELDRWDIAVDDTAGVPLARTPTGGFLRLVAQAVASDGAPVDLLALLKHPFARLGAAAPTARALARRLEIMALRGPRPPGGLGRLPAWLRLNGAEDLADWAQRAVDATHPLRQAMATESDLPTLVRAHVTAAEALAENGDGTPGGLLWAQEAGSTAAASLAEWIEVGAALGVVPGRQYPALFEALMASAAVRPRHGRHPRIAILGRIEARLLSADLVVLGGLNEGTWPPDPGADPWMSRPMRRDFGLPSPEAMVGLAAHDFVQAASAPRVVLTRAVKVDGAPTVPARWLARLDTVLAAADRPLDSQAAQRVHGWLAVLDRPGAARPVSPPTPRPPVSARPRVLSVSEVELLMRNPYALYAKRVLGLKPLDPLDQDPGAAERGMAIHAALAAFVRETGATLPADPLPALLAAGDAAFGAQGADDAVWAFWYPRFRRAAAWLAQHEAAWRGQEGAVPVAVEVDGTWRLALSAGGEVRLKARADRLDRLPDGRLAVIDYKTGGVPGEVEVRLGWAPQLPLEAAMAAAGAFREVAAAPAGVLTYWQVGGAAGTPGKERRLKDPAADLAAEAADGLTRVLDAFADPATPYLARPRPAAFIATDYDHLARLSEWGG